MVPLLRGAQVIRVWSGIEGYLPDMLPVMGWSRTTQSLLHAYGFCGHGFQLSPGVGYTLAEMIDEGQARIPIDAFAIDRFARSRPDQERLTGEFDAALASAMRPGDTGRIMTHSNARKRIYYGVPIGILMLDSRFSATMATSAMRRPGRSRCSTRSCAARCRTRWSTR